MEDLYQSKDRPIEIREELAKEDMEELKIKNNKMEGTDSIPAEVFKFIHSFILNISVALLQGDYSGALQIPVRSKRKVFRLA